MAKCVCVALASQTRAQNRTRPHPQALRSCVRGSDEYPKRNGMATFGKPAGL